MTENLFGKIDSRGSTPVTYNFTPLSTAEAFSTSKSYAVGDYCFYSGDYYKCTTAKAAGAWSADNFVKVTVSEELKGIVNGYHPDMTAGDAEQLVSTQYVTEKTPYLYRTTGGSSDVGNREYVRGITGGTVAWNQLCKCNRNTESASGVTKTNNGDGSVTLNGTATVRDSIPFDNDNTVLTANHVYFMSGYKKVGSNTGYIGLSGFQIDKGNGGLWKNTNPHETLRIRVDISQGDTFDNVKMTPQMFDLTQMLGTTIADYIYSLEQSNAGAGVAFFRKLFPNDYYPYDSGTLKSVEGVSSHEMVGFNQWDEEWEVGGINASNGVNTGETNKIRAKNYIRVLPSTNYYFGSTTTVGSGQLHYYDDSKNYISASGYGAFRNVVTTPPNCHYMRLQMNDNYGTPYKNDICINLAWSGYRNGEYEAYEKHSYPIDSSLTLRGIPKLDASNNLYYDGDVYAPDGTVTRKYGIVDLGTLTWVARTASVNTFFQSDGLRGIIKPPTDNTTVANCIVPNFTVEYWYSTVIGDRIIAVAGANDSYSGRISCQYTNATTAEEFKAAMSGVYMLYELATPTTESAEPYTEIQICDDRGTEEYVSTSIVPVGHTTDYPANLRDKLQHLPDLASADGNYIVSQNGTQMTLAPLPIVIPAPPTTDGTYTFRATVSNGVPTLSWVEE